MDTNIVVSGLGPDSPVFQGLMRMRDMVATRKKFGKEGIENLLRDLPARARDSMYKLAELVASGGGFNLGDATWHGLITGLSIDARPEQELRQVTFQKVPSGGRRLDRISFPHNMLRPTGTKLDDLAPATTGSEPTTAGVQVSPVSCFAYTELPSDTMESMILNWDTESPLVGSPDEYFLSADDAIKMLFLTMTLASALNTAWNAVTAGHGGSTLGLTAFDGWLYQLENDAACHKENFTAVTEWLTVGFKALWNYLPGVIARRSDLIIACSETMRQQFIEEVQESTLRIYGSYNQATDVAKYRSAVVEGFTDLDPLMADKVAVLTPRAALFLGVTNDVPKVVMQYESNGDYWKMSCRIRLDAKHSDPSVAVYGRKP